MFLLVNLALPYLSLAAQVMLTYMYVLVLTQQLAPTTVAHGLRVIMKLVPLIPRNKVRTLFVYADIQPSVVYR
jgi:hypothetical protein